MKEVAGNLKTFNEKLRKIYHNEPRPQHLNLNLITTQLILADDYNL